MSVEETQQTPSMLAAMPRRSTLQHHSASIVRPEARRHYGAGDEWWATSSRNEGEGQLPKPVVTEEHATNFLQQAANYAALAPVSTMNASRHDDDRSQAYAAPDVSSGQAMGRRYGLFRSRSAKAPSASPRGPDFLVAKAAAVRNVANSDESSSSESAPRLSTSSTESTTSDVRTPESMQAESSLWTGSPDIKGIDHLGQQVAASLDRRSPSFLQMSEPGSGQESLAEAGFGMVGAAAKGHANPALLEAALHMDDEAERASVTAASAPSGTSRARRPDSLLHMPRASFQTDATITPSANDVTSPDMTGAHLEKASEKSNSLSEQLEANLVLSSPTTDSTVEEKRRSDASTRIASPDSWRSLLPEHDPYYVAPGLTTSPGPSNSSAQDARTWPSPESVRRWSNSSFASLGSVSGAMGGTGYGTPSSSLNTPLYDADGSFGSGSRAAFAPLQHGYESSLRNLQSVPLTSSQSVDSRRASAIPAGLQQSTATDPRRHASFSTFDRFSPPAMRDSAKHAGSIDGSLTRESVASSASTSSVTSPALSINASPLASGKTPSRVCSLMGDALSRERWPCSRNSRNLSEVSRQSSPPVKPPVSPPASHMSHPQLSPRMPGGTRSELVSPSSRSPSFSLQTTPPPINHSVSKTIENTFPDASGGTTTTRTTTTTTTTTTTLTVQPQQAALSPPYAANRAPALPSKSTVAALAEYVHVHDIPNSEDFSVEKQPAQYILRSRLPGYSLDGITLATKHEQQLVIVADKWENGKQEHFERRIVFDTDADLAGTRASFDGSTLRISIPRRFVTA